MKTPKYIYHYYELVNGPFRNITELPVEKAEEVQSKIKEGFISKRGPGYLERRFDLEIKLKNHFIEKGGKPNRNDPFYFSLGPCEWLKTWYKNPAIIKIPLSDFETSQISFTYPDSMISFQLFEEARLLKYRKESNGQVFRINELEEVINKEGIPSEEKWQSIEAMTYDRYIEVQVWDDTIINKYKIK